MMWDACDGEVARWRGTSSPTGIFLDKFGHYTVETFIALALGVRAAGGLGEVTHHLGWMTLGALLAWLLCLNKALNDMVRAARAAAGLAALPDTAAGQHAALGPARRAAQRRAVRAVPPHLPLDRADTDRDPRRRRSSTRSRGDLRGTHVLLAVLVPLAALSVVGHFVAIVASEPGTCGVSGAVVRRRRADPGHPAGRAASARCAACSAQTGVELDVVVVGNGWQPTGLPDGVRAVAAAGERRHPGRPQRRGAARAAVSCCSSSTTTPRCATPDTLAASGRHVRRATRPRARTAARGRSRTARPAPRRWTPRLRVGDPARSSDVTALWEGAVAVRRALFDAGRRLGRTSSSTRTRASTWPGRCGTRAPECTTAGDIDGAGIR